MWGIQTRSCFLHRFDAYISESCRVLAIGYQDVYQRKQLQRSTNSLSYDNHGTCLRRLKEEHKDAATLTARSHIFLGLPMKPF